MKRPLAFAIALALSLPLTAAAQSRAPLDIETFALVPAPGQPEGIAIADDGKIYTGSNVVATGSRSDPSKIFAFDPSGQLLQEYVVPGIEGLVGMAFDGDGRLYVIDPTPPRILRLDPLTGQQTTYATFRDVLPCSQGGAAGDCSNTLGDDAPLANYPVFAPDGMLYVTDSRQALIWRIPPGGGPAEVWFSDAALEAVFGPNGIQFRADGTTLLFAITGSQAPEPTPTTGGLYELPVNPNGSPGSLSLFWQSNPFDGPDGFSIAASGNVYVALAATNQIAVVSPAGVEIARAPATPVDNALLDVPLDMPASTAFVGDRVLFTNHSLFTGNPDSWAILDLYAGEPGLPLFRPQGLPEPGAVGGLAALALLATLARLSGRRSSPAAGSSGSPGARA